MKLENYIEIYDYIRKPVNSMNRQNRQKIYPYYGAQGIVDYIDNYLFDGEYILLAEDGNNLATLNNNIATWANGKFWVNNHAHVLKTNSKMNQKYLFYWLNHANLTGYITGSAQPKLNKENILSIEIKPHSLQEQQHIVNTIGSVDNLIEKLQLMFVKIEKMALILFKKHESNNRVSFNQVFNTSNGGIFKSKYYTNYSKNKLITIKNVDDSGFNTKSVNYLCDDIADTKYLLSKGDIILTMTGNIGRVGIVDENNCFLNQRVLKVECVSTLYLYAYLLTYKKNIITLGKGTAQSNLSLEDLKKLVVKNSLNEINSFKKYDVIFSYMLNIKLQIKLLMHQKSLLLSKYF